MADESTVFTVRSNKSLDELREALLASCEKHSFGVLGEHDLRTKMREKGVSFDRRVLVFDVCNPQRAKTVLETDLRISAVLPCRISIHEDDDGYRLTTVRPEQMLQLFERPELAPVADEVGKTIVSIMEDAA